jgi:hypothetical protein
MPHSTKVSRLSDSLSHVMRLSESESRLTETEFPLSETEILGTLKKASAAAFQGTGSDPL